MQRNLVDTIAQMQAQGLDNNQIAQSLQREGYTNEQIFDAMNLAEQQKLGAPTMTQDIPPPINPMGFQPQSVVQPQQQDVQGEVQEIEELIEQIINEKWKDIEESIGKILDWKTKVEQNLGTLQTQLNDQKEQFQHLQNSVVGKVGDYDKNVLEVGTQLKAMEMAFSKVLPQFTENINELNRITSHLKKGK